MSGPPGGTLAGRPRPRQQRRGRRQPWRSGAIATAARPSPVRRLRPSGRRGRPYGARRLGGGIAFVAFCRVGARRGKVCRYARAPLSVSGGKTLRSFASRPAAVVSAAAARSSLLRVGRGSMRRNRKQFPTSLVPTTERSCYRSSRSSDLCSCWPPLPNMHSAVTPLCTSLHQARASFVRASPGLPVT